MKAKTVKKLHNIAMWGLTAAALYVIINGIVVASVFISIWGTGG